MPNSDGISSFRRPTLSISSMKSVFQRTASAPQTPMIIRDVDVESPRDLYNLGP